MRRCLWKIKELNPKAKELAKAYDISVFLAQVFLNRGIKEEDFKGVLDPKFVSLHCPSLLPDIEKAVARIKQAVQREEKVLVFGDYDVDGITSLAIFHEFANEFPKTFSFYIPHRIKEGYGLNKEAIARAKEEEVSLIIAFDCGTGAVEEIALAKSLKMDVIVVDHHLIGENPIKPFAFINPQRKDSKYPCKDLSAGALSFKLLQALTGSLPEQVLDLVALSLVCDVVPLKGENRALLRGGLKAIRQSPRLAIKALCKAGSVKQENIDTFHIGYILGPRINASGRVAHAQESLELFLTEDESKAQGIASKLGEYNKLRRSIEAQILKEAEQRIGDNGGSEYAIVVAGDGWHPGVLGIVASRLASKYYRPSFVFSLNQNSGKGSARSIESVHLVEALDRCADSLLAYGGHSKAAGLEIEREELENFREKINALIKEDSCSQDFIPTINVDALIDFSNIDMGLAEGLEKLKPYGEGNPKPLFAAYNISKKGSPKKINSFYSLWLEDGETTYEAICYDKDILKVIDYADSFNIVFSLQVNYYHNTPKLIIRDCRLSQGEG
ncbi:MAG: single-stranded-DNA-specific exonuclease RecJ [Candidatus Omnitrophica bacterium]|nr:single-stranded-DNA-specific exonuclease RecJ [Candidatus Omnitrophota bacterium]